MLRWDYDITTVHIYIIPLTQENQTFSQKHKNNTSFAFVILSFLQPPLFFSSLEIKSSLSAKYIFYLPFSRQSADQLLLLAMVIECG